MTKLFPLRVKRPERVCWGCARLCPASDMACGNGKDRTEHPSELFGDDWFEVRPPRSHTDDSAADGGEDDAQRIGASTSVAPTEPEGR